MIFNKKNKVAFFTLGCKLNFAETSTIARSFEEKGFQRVSFDKKADIYVINSCSVTESANKKSRQAIKKAIKKSPDSLIAVIGCYAQLKPDELAKIQGVDIILCEKEKFNLIKYIENIEKQEVTQIQTCEVENIEHFEPAFSFGDRTRSFLKVQDGCDYKCSYCTIPLARGKSRNDNIQKTIEQAEKISEQGIKEIILTGVNIGDFGKSTNESFYDLITELNKVENIERYRISSIEPNLLTDEIIEFVSESRKFAPHFHIPLQSGSDKILGLMQRQYKRELFEHRIKKIKSLMPYAAIGVDVIVGFPGETEFDFIDTYQFLEKLDISYLHVFSYSERENTKAVEIKGKVKQADITYRSKKMHFLSNKKKNQFYTKNLNTKRAVLFEAYNSNGKMYGFTDNYIKIETNFNKKITNKILLVKLKEISYSGNVQIY
ncbi:MAG: tRNA (N(6)-L-threonylcarbamoyladenosine(37)-C(2))-methylthiotransferase MtaB [Bacteroidales bacterium]|nr:tRNA (N(6)-L-threonylcarbamoyladenosine(37)-C(2))-methylthiotransferase MtaB [Bacteroidales bacterium]